MYEQRLFISCNDHEIPMVITYPDGPGPFPCMLLLHGFMSYKEGDGHLFTHSAKALAKANIASARIDFCSMGENRYSRKNYGICICIEETKAAFSYLRNHERIISDRIGILGHSLGGRIAFMSSSLPLKCLVTFNGAIDITVPFSLPVIDEEKINKEGYMILETSDGRAELLYPQFIKDAMITSNEIYNYTNPILLCVGENDPTLNPEISYSFKKNCPNLDIDMIVVANANHTFNAKTGDYTKVYELLEKVIAWLNEKL